MALKDSTHDSIWIDSRHDSPNLYLCWYDKAKRKVVWKSCRTTDRTEAERQKAARIITHAAGQALKADASGSEIGDEGVTLFRVFDYYWTEHAKYLPSAERTMIAIERFKEFFGDAALMSLTRQMQQGYVDSRDALSIAPATISTELSVLRAALRMAQDELGAMMPKIFDVDRDEPPQRWLSKEEARKLLDACRSWHIRLYAEIALQTGARPSAILDLTWKQIDFKHCRIKFNPVGRVQTTKTRPTIPISPELRDMLLAARERDKKNAKRKKRPVCGYVITYGGYAVGSIKKAFRATAAEAGFDDVTPYVIRHTAATWMAQSGVELWDIASYLGTSLRMVEKHYAHHHPDHLKKAAKAMAAAVAKVKAKAEPLALRKGRKTRKDLLAAQRAASSVLGVNVVRASASAIEVEPPAAPQLHHKSGRPTRSRKSQKPQDSAEKSVVGGTGIEPVTPTMST